ncbi:MAG TPA: hypothetical protein VGO31_11725 [Microbacteriaceae bacterium]|nr:hypothetical protein [Microbacteriaceae bacterium]
MSRDFLTTPAFGHQSMEIVEESRREILTDDSSCVVDPEGGVPPSPFASAPGTHEAERRAPYRPTPTTGEPKMGQR